MRGKNESGEMMAGFKEGDLVMAGENESERGDDRF